MPKPFPADTVRKLVMGAVELRLDRIQDCEASEIQHRSTGPGDGTALGEYLGVHPAITLTLEGGGAAPAIVDLR